MLKFKSLTSKFVFISLIMLTFLAIYLYIDFRFTHRMTGEGARINIAGRQRMLIYLNMKGVVPPFSKGRLGGIF